MLKKRKNNFTLTWSKKNLKYCPPNACNATVNVPAKKTKIEKKERQILRQLGQKKFFSET